MHKESNHPTFNRRVATEKIKSESMFVNGAKTLHMLVETALNTNNESVRVRACEAYLKLVLLDPVSEFKDMQTEVDNIMINFGFTYDESVRLKDVFREKSVDLLRETALQIVNERGKNSKGI